MSFTNDKIARQLAELQAINDHLAEVAKYAKETAENTAGLAISVARALLLTLLVLIVSLATYSAVLAIAGDVVPVDNCNRSISALECDDDLFTTNPFFTLITKDCDPQFIMQLKSDYFENFTMNNNVMWDSSVVAVIQPDIGFKDALTFNYFMGNFSLFIGAVMNSTSAIWTFSVLLEHPPTWTFTKTELHRCNFDYLSRTQLESSFTLAQNKLFDTNTYTKNVNTEECDTPKENKACTLQTISGFFEMYQPPSYSTLRSGNSYAILNSPCFSAIPAKQACSVTFLRIKRFITVIMQADNGDMFYYSILSQPNVPTCETEGNAETLRPTARIQSGTFFQRPLFDWPEDVRVRIVMLFTSTSTHTVGPEMSYNGYKSMGWTIEPYRTCQAYHNMYNGVSSPADLQRNARRWLGYGDGTFSRPRDTKTCLPVSNSQPTGSRWNVTASGKIDPMWALLGRDFILGVTTVEVPLKSEYTYLYAINWTDTAKMATGYENNMVRGSRFELVMAWEPGVDTAIELTTFSTVDFDRSNYLSSICSISGKGAVQCTSTPKEFLEVYETYFRISWEMGVIKNPAADTNFQFEYRTPDAVVHRRTTRVLSQKAGMCSTLTDNNCSDQLCDTFRSSDFRDHLVFVDLGPKPAGTKVWLGDKSNVCDYYANTVYKCDIWYLTDNFVSSNGWTIPYGIYDCTDDFARCDAESYCNIFTAGNTTAFPSFNSSIDIPSLPIYMAMGSSAKDGAYVPYSNFTTEYRYYCNLNIPFFKPLFYTRLVRWLQRYGLAWFMPFCHVEAYDVDFPPGMRVLLSKVAPSYLLSIENLYDDFKQRFGFLNNIEADMMGTLGFVKEILAFITWLGTL